MAGNGSAELRALAVRLKAAGERDLRLQLFRGVRAGAQPLVEAVKRAALAQLPKGGGLNAQVASQKVSVSVRTGASTAGVRLTTRAPDTAETDAGFVRHPTFGRRGRGDWKTLEYAPMAGWWSKTLDEGAPLVTPALLAVMRTVAAEIEGA